MVTTTLEAAQSFPLPEIPVKLRCNICSGLARGAVRLPCCEQAICDTCRSNLPGVCPVCDHSPLNADDCKPNSALRTTVAVFLRTAEKKHALALQKEQKATQQQQQQQQQKPPIREPTPTPEVKAQEPQSTENAPLVTAEESSATSVANPNTPVAGPAILAPTNENQQRTPGSYKPDTDNSPSGSTEATDVKTGANGVVPQMEYNQQNGWFNGQQMNNMGQPMFPGQEMVGAGWGYNPMQGGWDNGYVNGMMGYPMMNPMAMAQSGYGGGNFGSMGGVGGFNGQNGGDMGGWNNGWNGQNNMGFNQGMAMRNGGYNYAPSAAGGYNHQQVPSSQQYQNPHFQRQQNIPRGGGFTGATAGSRPFNSSDPIQQQQSQQQRQRQHPSQEGSQEGQQEQAQDGQQSLEQDSTLQGQIEGIGEAKGGASSITGETKGEKIPSIVSGDLDDQDATAAITTTTTTTTATTAGIDSEAPGETESTVLAGADNENDIIPEQEQQEGSGLQPISSVIPITPLQPAEMYHHDDYSMGGMGQGYPMGGFPPYANFPVNNGFGPPGVRNGFRNGFVGNNNNRAGFRGGFNGGMRGGPGHFDAPPGPPMGMMPNAIPVDKMMPGAIVGKGVEGAPTGPKAMREGRPNRGMMPRGGGSFSGRGGYNGAGSSWSRSMSPNDRTDRTDRGRSYSRSLSPGRDRSRDRSRSRSRPRRRHSPTDRDRDQERTSISPERERERDLTPKRDATPEPTVADDIPASPTAAGAGTKRSRSPSLVANERAGSRSRSRSRHKRSRRHDKEKRSSGHKSSRHHRSHRSGRKHRRSRSRSRGDRVDSPARGEEDEDGTKERRRHRHDRDRERRHRRHRRHRSTEKDGGEEKKDKERERRVSYKYEDEGDLERRAERDREAERWVK